MNILYCMIYCFLDKSAQIVPFVSSTTFKDNEIANLFVFRDCFAIQFSLKCWGHALIQSEKFKRRHHQIDQACSKAKQGPIDTHLGCLHMPTCVDIGEFSLPISSTAIARNHKIHTDNKGPRWAGWRLRKQWQRSAPSGSTQVSANNLKIQSEN